MLNDCVGNCIEGEPLGPSSLTNQSGAFLPQPLDITFTCIFSIPVAHLHLQFKLKTYSIATLLHSFTGSFIIVSCYRNAITYCANNIVYNCYINVADKSSEISLQKINVMRVLRRTENVLARQGAVNSIRIIIINLNRRKYSNHQQVIVSNGETRNTNTP